MSERELIVIYASIKSNRNPNQNVWVGLAHKILGAKGTSPRTIHKTITTLNKAWHADKWKTLIHELTVNNPNALTETEIETWKENF